MKYVIILIIVILIIVISFIYFSNFKKESFHNYSDNKIPKIIISTYHTKNKIPSKIYRNIKRYAKNYKHIIFDDNDVINFLRENYGENMVITFNSLEGAHKGDLFRYCYLYKYGGIYLDIKTELIKDIDNIFNKRNINLYTALSILPNTIYQGVIASTPNNPLFKDLIEYIVKIKKPVTSYTSFVEDFYSKLKIYCNTNMLKPGYIKDSKGNNIFLFNEMCTNNKYDCKDGLDRYNRCCYIYNNNEKIIKVRYSDYPW